MTAYVSTDKDNVFMSLEKKTHPSFYLYYRVTLPIVAKI